VLDFAIGALLIETAVFPSGIFLLAFYDVTNWSFQIQLSLKLDCPVVITNPLFTERVYHQ